MTTPVAAQNSMAADSRVQERVFAFLTDPTTHALKIKRAIRFPYLDYSTLAKRKAACDQEIAINRQFAPQIYHRVIPITQNDQGSLSLNGDGTPVEFAIEMARFDESRTGDLLADRDLYAGATAISIWRTLR